MASHVTPGYTASATANTAYCIPGQPLTAARPANDPAIGSRIYAMGLQTIKDHEER